MLTSAKARLERLPIVGFAALIVVPVLYPAASGKKTLHALGIGGGIPVQILLKTMDIGSTAVTAQLIYGCLILNSGNRVIIQPTDAPNKLTTDAPSKLPCDQELLYKDVSYATMYKGIEVLSGSDIITLSGFTPLKVGGR